MIAYTYGLLQIFNIILNHFYIFLDVPGPPSNLRPTTVEKDSITVDWNKPRYDGGRPIKTYLVEYMDAAARGAWIPADTVDSFTTSLRVPNLTEGKEYYFRVFAENEIGKSEPCEMKYPVRTKGEIGMYF